MARKRFVTGESAPARGGKECENLPAALQEQLEALLQKLRRCTPPFTLLIGGTIPCT